MAVIKRPIIFFINPNPNHQSVDQSVFVPYFPSSWVLPLPDANVATAVAPVAEQMTDHDCKMNVYISLSMKDICHDYCKSRLGYIATLSVVECIIGSRAKME